MKLTENYGKAQEQNLLKNIVESLKTILNFDFVSYAKT
jgi:hypothetical protein